MAALGLHVTVQMHFQNDSDSNWVIILTEKPQLELLGKNCEYTVFGSTLTVCDVLSWVALVSGFIYFFQAIQKEKWTPCCMFYSAPIDF